MDWFGDWTLELDLVRLRSCGRFGGRLTIVREPQDSAVSGLVYATSVRCGGGVRGLIRRLGVGLGISPHTVCRLSAVCGKESRNIAVPG